MGVSGDKAQRALLLAWHSGNLPGVPLCVLETSKADSLSSGMTCPHLLLDHITQHDSHQSRRPLKFICNKIENSAPPLQQPHFPCSRGVTAVSWCHLIILKTHVTLRRGLPWSSLHLTPQLSYLVYKKLCLRVFGIAHDHAETFDVLTLISAVLSWTVETCKGMGNKTKEFLQQTIAVGLLWVPLRLVPCAQKRQLQRLQSTNSDSPANRLPCWDALRSRNSVYFPPKWPITPSSLWPSFLCLL